MQPRRTRGTEQDQEGNLTELSALSALRGEAQFLQVRGLADALRSGGQRRGRTADLPLSGVKVDQVLRALPARGWLPERACGRDWLPSLPSLPSACARSSSGNVREGDGASPSMSVRQQVRRRLRRVDASKNTVEAERPR